MLNPLIIWRVTDGKAGHEAQTRGLVDAIARLRPVECHDLEALPQVRAAACWMVGRFAPGRSLPAPDLIVGAGHTTHFTVLAAGRARGGRRVVLMRPSLPIGLFDLCIIPGHDKPPERKNVVPTTGVLNPVRLATQADAGRGLILIGGPSAHHVWDGPGVLEQVLRVVSAAPSVRWILTTSRRSPEGFTDALHSQVAGNLEVVPCAETGPGWVARQLDACATVWVTEDSVSMIFEALTAGARVGLLAVPGQSGESRVRRAVEDLVRSGRVCRLVAGEVVPEPPRQREVLAEADRCARILLERFSGLASLVGSAGSSG